MKKPAAVLWDMDGTLVDTEPYWIECEIALSKEFGGPWNYADSQTMIGSNLIDTGTAMRDRGGVPLEPVEIVERLIEGVIERVARHLPWRPGARELLEACAAADIPCALVTMSWRRLVTAALSSLSDELFAVTITGDEVARGKPDPEPYLAAARALGVEPAECVAIEDSRTGTASALAAGCATLGVPHVVTLAPAKNLTIVDTLVGMSVDDLGDLLP